MPSEDPTPPTRETPKTKLLPTWFKLCALVLVVLIMLKVLQLQVFIEISFDGIPYLTPLTEIETYFIPLGLLLIYILWNWVWSRFFRSR